MAASQEDQKEDREDVEIKVARQFFRVLNLISAIGLPSVCSEDTEVRYRCFPSGEHQTDDAKKRRGKFFVEIEERKRERERATIMKCWLRFKYAQRYGFQWIQISIKCSKNFFNNGGRGRGRFERFHYIENLII